MAGKLGLLSGHAPYVDPDFGQFQWRSRGPALRGIALRTGHTAGARQRSGRNIRCNTDHGAPPGAPARAKGMSHG